jgi:hypothetical protein
VLLLKDKDYFKAQAAVYQEEIELADGRILERSYIPFSAVGYIRESYIPLRCYY